MTSIIENEQVKVATQSTVSAFVGPDALTQSPSETVGSRVQEEFVESDTVDFSKRLIQFPATPNNTEFISFGPGEVNYFFCEPIKNFMDVAQFRDMLDIYWAISYTSIKVRISVSDPKGIVGGAHFGWYPYMDWYDKNPSETFTVQKSKELLTFGLINGPNTHLVSYGASQDVTFDIPWTFKFPCLPSNAIFRYWNAAGGTPQNSRPPYGTPVIWGLEAMSNYVSSLSMPAKVRVYYEYIGLKFYGPSSTDYSHTTGSLQQHSPSNAYYAQSGLEVVAMETAIAATAGAAAATIGEFFQGDDPVSDNNVNWRELAHDGTYESPQAVQMAYLGDLSSIGPPSVSPIFTSGIQLPPNYTKHSVAEFLRRPQLIDTKLNSDVVWNTGINYYGNPMNPGGASTSKHAQQANYLRWFGMLNRWWRGTLHLCVIVLGHPMVEVEFQASVIPAWNASQGTVNRRFTITPVHTSIFSGTKRFDIPLPFLTVQDHLPLVDGLLANPRDFASSICNMRMRVVSTMLSVAPKIPALVYLYAGEDFEFEQPSPPGLLRTEFDPVLPLVPLLPNGEERKKKTYKSDEYIAQVRLPFEDQAEMFETRACALQTSSILPSLSTLEDYMSIWSRSVPFGDYNNNVDEEPIPDATVGLTYPMWYPPIDRSEDEDANNSWYFTLDYVAYFSSMFVLWRGSLGIKVIQAKDSGDEYKYIALGDVEDVLHQKTHCPFAYDLDNFPPDSNPGNGAAATPTGVQPALETTLPYRGGNIWSLTYYNGVKRGTMRDYDVRNASVFHNVVLASSAPIKLQDTLLRKAGADFALCVETLLPPPTMWIARGYHWS